MHSVEHGDNVLDRCCGLNVMDGVKDESTLGCKYLATA